MMLPGALKYGGMEAFARLCTPGQLIIHNQKDGSKKLSPEEVIDRILR